MPSLETGPGRVSFGVALKKIVTAGTAVQSVALLVFVTIGLLLVPLLGFEDDELIFVNLFMHPNECFSRLPLFGGHAIPIMAMSYLGALKSWLYSPLLLLATPTVWLVRVAALLLAALTIALTGRLMTLIEGRTASLVVVCLLASDVTFLFTAVFDWRPVVLQHLLLVVSLLLMIEWYSRRHRELLFLGGLTIGLALWDKSLFLWQLAGMSAALIVVAWPVLRQLWSRANAWIFARGLLLGALPLIGANLRHHFATFKDNGHMTFAGFGLKAVFMRLALDGQASAAFFLDGGNSSIDRIHRPFERWALSLAHSPGGSPSLWRFYPGLIVILLGICLTNGTRRKWILFFLISGCASWFQSAITLHAGNVIHHAVLSWVAWYCAISLSAAVLLKSPVRYVRTAAMLVVCAGCIRGILVIGANYGELIVHPGNPRWTNGDAALADNLLSSGVKRVIVADWGMKNVVRARSEERISVDDQSVALNYGAFNQNAFQACTNKDCVVVRRAPGRGVFSAAPATLDRALLAAGFTETAKMLIYDTHGVPAFEFFHIVNPTHGQNRGLRTGTWTTRQSPQTQRPW